MSLSPEPSPAAPRWLTWLTGAALAVILLLAARARFALPLMPASDPDTWGYLHPALARLTGQGFIHTQGRNFLYPGWVFLLLASTGTLRAITVAQHLVGLAGGVLMWVCWRQWRAWFADPRLPAWADALLGLGLVAFVEFSVSLISFEHTIRPEAIFPFFALLDLSLLLAFLRTWFVSRRAGRAAALAGAALFVALLLYQLKPSFGFALGVAAAPVLAAALVPWRQPGRPRWLPAGAAGGAAVAAALLFAWPEHRLSRGDPMSTLFFPETLLTIHADIICDQIGEDARDHASTPYGTACLSGMHQEFASELGRASAASRQPYRTLGFNPDYLMYTSGSLCSWLGAQYDPSQVAAFAFYYYRRAWLHQPARMLAKIARQLGAFYSLHCPAFSPAHGINTATLYRKSVIALDYANYRHDLSLYPPGRDYLETIRQLATPPGLPPHSPEPLPHLRRHRAYSPGLLPASTLMIDTNVAASVGALPMLCLFAVALAAAGLARAGIFHAPAVGRLLTPGWVLLLPYGFIFGNTLTIAVIHSLSIDRYSMNLLVFCAPALMGTIAWLGEFILALRGARRVAQETGPAPFAAPAANCASARPV